MLQFFKTKYKKKIHTLKLTFSAGHPFAMTLDLANCTSVHISYKTSVVVSMSMIDDHVYGGQFYCCIFSCEIQKFMHPHLKND